MNNTGRNTIAQVLENAIKECQNVIKIAELENTTENTVCCTVDLTNQLAQAKAEVERLESVISECEAAKAATEAKKKKEEEEAEKFLNSLTPSGREVLAYLEGMKTLAQGDNLIMVNNVLRVFTQYTGGCELTLTANLSAYISILVKEEKYDPIRLLETITLKIDEIQRNVKGTPDPKVNGLDKILLSIQDIY